VKAYVINLDSRVDRWTDVKAQSSQLGIEIVRISAVTHETVSPSPFVTRVIAATWQSHQRAMGSFLESDDDFGLIMEDDFVMSRGFELKGFDLHSTLRSDFFQLGFLITGPTDRIQVLVNGYVDASLKFLRFASKGAKNLKGKLLIREQFGIPFNVVCNDIRPGAHAYIVSREFARAAQKINSPEFLSADAVFMSMGWMRSFKMLRLRKSVFGQSKSQTSITERFINN
jgi:hypothetical protein